MHRLIRILVFAKDEEAALEAAHKVVNEKLKTTSNGGPPFDYYVDFTESPKEEPGTIFEKTIATVLDSNYGFIASFGKGRWGPIPPVLQVSTVRFPTDDPRGMKQARAAFEQIRAEFDEYMALIRHHVANYTNDELFNRVHGKGFVEIDGVKIHDKPGLFQYYCECVGGRPLFGNLYDFMGHCITRLSYSARDNNRLR